MIHNLNHATRTLQNTKSYSIKDGSGDNVIKAMEQILKRLYRTFAHTHTYHQEFFDDFEVRTTFI